MLRWGSREATNALNEVMIEPLESERLPHLRAILEGLAGVGFTLAIFDTAGSDNAAARFVTDAADICLLPTRPTRSDVAATAATFRAVFLAKRKAAFVLNQCPPTFRSSRTSDAAKDLTNSWRSGRTDAFDANGFPGCDGRRSRCDRICWEKSGRAGSRGAVGWTRAQFEERPSVPLVTGTDRRRRARSKRCLMLSTAS